MASPVALLCLVCIVILACSVGEYCFTYILVIWFASLDRHLHSESSLFLNLKWVILCPRFEMQTSNMITVEWSHWTMINVSGGQKPSAKLVIGYAYAAAASIPQVGYQWR